MPTPKSKINLHAYHAQVWDFRREVAECWTTPPTQDAIRFAYCESNEALKEYRLLADEMYWIVTDTQNALRVAFNESGDALDQYLRQNASYKRNRTIDVNDDELLNELADTAMMLLTAIGPKLETGYFDHLGYSTINGICTGTGRCLGMVKAKMTKGEMAMMTRVALGTVLMIAEYPNMDLSARLATRLARIKAKHCAGLVETQTAAVA